MSIESRDLISIIVPVYNEEEVLSIFYKELCKVIDDLPFNFQILFVNDGSVDSSEKIITDLVNQDDRVIGIFLSRNFGHQAALTAGLDHALGNALLCMDGDLQHPPTLIPKLLEYWKAGYDIVFTIRKEVGEKFSFKGITSKLFYRLINSVSDTKIHTNAADFRLIDRQVAKIFQRELRERKRFIRGLVNWVGFKTIGVEFQVNERAGGTSKYSLLKMLKLAISGVTSFSTLPLTLGIYVGGFLGVISIAYGIYVILVAVIVKNAVPGWASTLITITFLGAVQIFLIGLLGIYIGYLFEEVRGRPIYIIRRTVQKSSAVKVARKIKSIRRV